MHNRLLLCMIAAASLAHGALRAEGLSEDRRDNPQLERAHDIVRAHSYPLNPVGGSFSGDGWERLLAEAGASQFLLIGEVHNTAQVNRFVAALFDALHRDAGYDHLVLEQDAALIEALESAAETGGLNMLHDKARQHLLGLHFLGDAELDLYALAARSGPPGKRNLWGVDRALQLSPGLAFLRSRVDDETLVSRIDTIVAAANEYDLSALVSFAPMKSREDNYIVAPDVRLDSLLADLSRHEAAEVRWMANHLQVSRKNLLEYRREHATNDPWGYRANLDRENLMKRNFARYYLDARDAGEELPKAVVKMGHWHVVEGRSAGMVHTLGNALHGSTALNGTGALSIALTVANEPGRHWTITDYPDYAYIFPAAALDHWTLVDLRPLRGPLHSGQIELSDEARNQVLGFDYLLVMAGTDAETYSWLE